MWFRKKQQPDPFESPEFLKLECERLELENVALKERLAEERSYKASTEIARDEWKRKYEQRLQTELQHTELEILGAALQIILAQTGGKPIPNPLPQLFDQRSALLNQISGMGLSAPGGLSGLAGLGNLFGRS